MRILNLVLDFVRVHKFLIGGISLAMFLVSIILVPVFVQTLPADYFKKRKIWALFFAVLGMIILTQPWEWQSFLTSIAGDILASLNGFLYAIYLLLGAYSAQIRLKIPFYVSVSWILFWGFVWGIILFLILSLSPLPSEVFTFSIENILNPYILSLGLLLTIVGSIVPYGLIMLSNKFQIESSTQSILMLGEPISAVILGFIFLSEPITIWYIIGGIPMLFAIAIIMGSVNGKSSID